LFDSEVAYNVRDKEYLFDPQIGSDHSSSENEEMIL
jgi:hypothetical protein